jgi:hypothetical protein
VDAGNISEVIPVFCCLEAGRLIRIENINKEERKVEND